MNLVFLLIAGVVILAVYFVAGPIVVSTYRRYRGRRTIVCPENDQIAEMEIKAGQAGLLAAFGKHRLRVKWCSLWPRRQGCAEECLKENWQSAGQAQNNDEAQEKVS